MRPNGIENIRIQNFKSFQEEKEFDIGRNHVLIFGPNGSGKSSLYWALYTLFQSAVKPVNKIAKYFTLTNDENLLNINDPTLPAYVKVKTKVGATEREFTLSNTGVAGDNPNLRELNQASEFISHRLLINFYNFRNSKEIDLFSVFDRDILPFVFGEVNFRDKVLAQAFDEIETKVRSLVGVEWRERQRIEANELANFNREIARLVEFINNNATLYLDTNFAPNDIKIKVTLKGVYRISSYKSVDQTKYYLFPPVYRLSVENKKADGTFHPVERPQSFLNEARLTKIGIAIRFCLLQKRPIVPLRILALDDMLISLDLDNRLNLIRTILNLYGSDYQLFIFTHEKGFYNEVKRNIADDINNWKLYEFQIPENQKIRFKPAKSEIQKATAFLENGDFENCALELRKLGEIIFRNFLEEKKPDIFQIKKFVSFGNMLDEAKAVISQSIVNKFQEKILELNLTDAEWAHVTTEDFTAVRTSPTMAPASKAKVMAARTAIFNTVKSVKSDTHNAFKFVNEVINIKDRLLNYGAHPTDDTLFRTEMEEAVVLFEKLQAVLKKV